MWMPCTRHDLNSLCCVFTNISLTACFPHVKRVGIRVAEHRYRPQTHRIRTPDDPASYLSSVRDQELVEGPVWIEIEASCCRREGADSSAASAQ